MKVLLAGRAYRTDFVEPVRRNDWILTGQAALHFTFDRHLSADLSYTCEQGIGGVPHTPGRE